MGGQSAVSGGCWAMNSISKNKAKYKVDDGTFHSLLSQRNRVNKVGVGGIYIICAKPSLGPEHNKDCQYWFVDVCVSVERAEIHSSLCEGPLLWKKCFSRCVLVEKPSALNKAGCQTDCAVPRSQTIGIQERYLVSIQSPPFGVWPAAKLQGQSLLGLLPLHLTPTSVINPPGTEHHYSNYCLCPLMQDSWLHRPLLFHIQCQFGFVWGLIRREPGTQADTWAPLALLLKEPCRRGRAALVLFNL